MDRSVQDAAYVYALGRLRGIGSRAIKPIVAAFPEPEALLNASHDALERALGARLTATLLPAIKSQWPTLLQRALRLQDRHMDHGIVPLPITSPMYPRLLAQIVDPPLILYVRGDVDAVTMDAVAVVGTREATNLGREIARRVASRCVREGFCIVSGLARGIDTAAHTGAVEAGGVTVAVLATSIDKIYPAENKALAARILDGCGALVSEVAFGDPSSRIAFVQRDRIQSGLSLAVVPVQTDVKGGTMHTVRYAEEQGRLLFCPTPPSSEAVEAQYAGVHMLLREGRARFFQADNYETVFGLLREHRVRLLGDQQTAPSRTGPSEAPALRGTPENPELPAVEASKASPMAGAQARVTEMELPGFPPRPPMPRALPGELELLALLREGGFVTSPDEFERLVSNVRRRWFGDSAAAIAGPEKPKRRSVTRAGRTRKISSDVGAHSRSPSDEPPLAAAEAES